MAKAVTAKDVVEMYLACDDLFIEAEDVMALAFKVKDRYNYCGPAKELATFLQIAIVTDRLKVVGNGFGTLSASTVAKQVTASRKTTRATSKGHRPALTGRTAGAFA